MWSNCNKALVIVVGYAMDLTMALIAVACKWSPRRDGDIGAFNLSLGIFTLLLEFNYFRTISLMHHCLYQAEAAVY